MKLAIRLIATGGLVTALIGAFQVLVILSFTKFTLDPSPQEISLIVHEGVPLILFFVGAFFIAIMIAVWPLARFVNQASRGVQLSDPTLLKVQARIVNYGYQVGFISVFFYFVIYPVMACLWCYLHLGWGPDKLLYATLAGMIAGIINLPLSIYTTNLITPPMLRETFRLSTTLPQASRTGYPISLRTKLIFAFGTLTLSTLVYTTVVGYSQARQSLEAGRLLDADLKQFDQCRKCHDFKGMEAQPVRLEHSEVFDRLRSGRQERFARLSQRMNHLWLYDTLVVVVALGLALVLSYLAAHDFNRPIRDMMAHARRLGAGHWDAEMQLVSTDEFAGLAQTFNEMAHQIRIQINKVNRLADNIREAIRQLEVSANLIQSVSAEQSSGATEQATAVTEASSIAQEIVVTAKQIAERASQVDQVSAGTLQACEDGQQKLSTAVAGFENIRDQMTSITTAMERLEDRFQELGKITGMIEDVAEQTELLALNAALEAAGAGDQGRRFGVVAQATRRLATRASEATIEIRNLIGALRDATLQAIQMAERGHSTVESGRTLIDEVTKAIEQISAQASNTSLAVREITLSTQQQTSASEQMAHTIAEVNEVAKQVAEGAKEIERIFNDLSKFTQSLHGLVGK